MIFMFLFYGDERVLATLPREERNALVERHVRYNVEVLQPRVEVLAVRAFQPTTAARTVRPRGDQMVVTDGPYAQSALALTGFYLVECRDLGEALELAKLYPMPQKVGCVEVRPVLTGWEYAPSIETTASPEAIWRLYQDVSRWPEWKYGVQRVELTGPFAAGSTGTITPVGQPPMPFRIVAATENEGYISETRLADGVPLRLEHTLTPLPGGGTRVVHKAHVPRAALDVFGDGFSPNLNAGINVTLAALSSRAAGGAGRRRKSQATDVTGEEEAVGRDSH
jgi:hypothetical protein